MLFKTAATPLLGLFLASASLAQTDNPDYDDKPDFDNLEYTVVSCNVDIPMDRPVHVMEYKLHEQLRICKASGGRACETKCTIPLYPKYGQEDVQNYLQLCREKGKFAPVASNVDGATAAKKAGCYAL